MTLIHTHRQGWSVINPTILISQNPSEFIHMRR
jgi:hypothetical protein